jgi:hypothetical protein
VEAQVVFVSIALAIACKANRVANRTPKKVALNALDLLLMFFLPI